MSRKPAALFVSLALLAGAGCTGPGQSAAPSTSAASASPTSGPSRDATIDPTNPPVSSAWRPAGAMASPHAWHATVQLADGSVLLAGGSLNDQLDGKPLAAADVYDQVAKRWTATAPMLEARAWPTGSLLDDGTVLIVGGSVTSAPSLASAERYDPATGAWTPAGRMHEGRGGHTATLLPGGQVLVVGGWTFVEILGSAELYDPASGTWTRAMPMSRPRAEHTATLLPDSTVLVVGGNDDGSTEIFDPTAGTWSAGPALRLGRSGHTMTVLPDGTLLVAGGHVPVAGGSGQRVQTQSVERYDPSTG